MLSQECKARHAAHRAAQALQPTSPSTLTTTTDWLSSLVSGVGFFLQYRTTALGLWINTELASPGNEKLLGPAASSEVSDEKAALQGTPGCWKDAAEQSNHTALEYMLVDLA